MKKRVIANIGIILLSAIFLFACAAGKEQYDIGMQLSSAGKHSEAIAYLNQAVEQEPDNEKYKNALSDLKNSLINDLIAQGSDALNSVSPLTVGAINKAKAKLAEAKEIDTDHPAVTSFSVMLEKKEKSFLLAVNNLYSSAKKDFAAKKWLKAYFNLQQIQSIFPNYEDSGRLLQQISAKGSGALYKLAKTMFDKEDYQSAAKLLNKVLSLNPNHALSKKLLSQVRKRDTKDYFLDQGRKAAMAQNWEMANKAYMRALEYSPEDQNLKELINNIRLKAALFYIREAKTQMYAGWLFKAFEGYKTALKYADNKEETEETEISSFRKELCSQAQSAAKSFEAKEMFGSAWFWYDKIKSIDLDFPEIFYRIQSMEDKIMQRLKKSIAVFDFGSPSNAPDAGTIFANKLSTFLFKTASKDVKILERENLKSILDEMKLGQIGVVSPRTAKEMGRVYGIDVAVMGSVLRYNVDSSSYSDTKTVVYKVKKTQENIDYLNWKAKNPKPTKEQLAGSPVPYINKMVDVEKEYKVSIHKKVSFVTVTFRIVDVKTGENILVDTIPRTKIAKDETSAGVKIAGIKFDPLEIHTDTQLLQELTDEVVAELGREGLSPLKNLAKTYFDEGEKHLRRRDKLKAAESFTNSIFNEKVRMIQESPISMKAGEYLENIFRDYKVIPET